MIGLLVICLLRTIMFQFKYICFSPHSSSSSNVHTSSSFDIINYSLEGLVPNLYPPICTKTSDRRGRTCISSHINVGRLGTLEYNSFRWCAIRLFNQLPLFVRNTTVCSIHSFKKQLDSYLSTVPDSPCLPGFNNSLALDHGDCLRWQTPRDGLAGN